MGDYCSFDMTGNKFFRVGVGEDARSKAGGIVVGFKGFGQVRVTLSRPELELLAEALAEFRESGQETWKSLAPDRPEDRRPAYAGGKTGGSGEPW